MKTKILGIQDIQFTNANGEEIIGKNVFCAFPEDGVIGLRCEKYFLKKDTILPKDMKINETVDLIFNRKGKIEAIIKVD